MHPRRPLLKRVAVWTAAFVLLLAGYVASSAFVVCITVKNYPASLPVLKVIYSPIEVYVREKLPGTKMLERYARWVQNALDVH
jgi:hypothetical protein